MLQVALPVAVLGVEHLRGLRTVRHADVGADHALDDRAVLHARVDRQAPRDGAADLGQHVGTLVGDRRGTRQRHALRRQVVALADGRAEDLGAVLAVDEARGDGRGDLVGVGDAVVAAEHVLGEELREVEVGDAAVVVGQAVLVAVGRAHVEEARLQRLQQRLAEERRVALEHEPRVHGRGGQPAVEVRRHAGRLVGDAVVRVVVRELRRDEPAGPEDRVRDAGRDHVAVARRERGVDEARRVHVDAEVEAAQHVEPRAVEEQLRRLLVRRHDRRHRILQRLVAQRVQRRVPVRLAVRDGRVAREDPLRRQRDGAREVDEVVVVGDLRQVRVPGPGSHLEVVERGRRVAVAAVGAPVVGQAFEPRVAVEPRPQVAGIRAQLQPARRDHLGVQRQIVVGREVEVIRLQEFDAVARRDRQRGGQEPALPAVVERERQPRRREDGHALEDDLRVPRLAHLRGLVELHALRLQVPVLLLGAARGVDELLEVDVVAVDEGGSRRAAAAGKARTVGRHRIAVRVQRVDHRVDDGRLRDVAPVARARQRVLGADEVAAVVVELQPQLGAGEDVAFADELHRAVGEELVVHLHVAHPVRLQHLAARAAQLGVAGEHDVGVGGALDAVGRGERRRAEARLLRRVEEVVLELQLQALGGRRRRRADQHEEEKDDADRSRRRAGRPRQGRTHGGGASGRGDCRRRPHAERDRRRSRADAAPRGRVGRRAS